MPNIASCFTEFTQPVAHLTLPDKFTFPFYYQPDAISVLAVEQLQQQLELHIPPTHHDADSGKMFGVLVVQNSQQQLGYLAAYSGQLESPVNGAINFVPAVADMQLHDDEYLAQSRIINDINGELELLENSEQFNTIQRAFNQATSNYQQQLLAQQAVRRSTREQRKQQRNDALQQLNDSERQQLHTRLAAQSIAEKKQLQALKQHWQSKLAALQQTLDSYNSNIAQLKKRRKTLSKNLQKKLFAQYQFLNAEGKISDLNTIFAAIPEQSPPAGAGDCAAPKLLQYAYQHNLRPIAMAEFWWGAAPKSAIRHHKHYYPSCYSKCQPILGHMLKGLTVAENPLLVNPAQGKQLTIVYQDDDLLVVNKPAEFLSVPGVNIEDSVYLRIKTQFPHATGPLIVHRLDMSTSGLLIIALNKRAHKALQKQFIERQVEKRYVALVAGNITEDSGTINLPLRLDFDDKPRQLVCYQHGKPSLTTWQVLERKENTTRLQLFPKTGRTHQLRVHCAHPRGLNTPIVGDDHYGVKADRLHLHAEYLSFTHPINHRRLEFAVAPSF